VLWAPFVLMFVASFAVRMALMIPIEPRANWIFRITEHDAARVDQLDAAVHIVRRFGVIVPVVLTAPIQWLVLGRGAVGAVAVTLLCGWLLVEILMTGWARIPCACGYMPGKGFVPQRVLTRFSSFVFFTTVGAGLAGLGAAGRPGSFVFATVLLGVVVVLRRRRRRAWIDAPLAFEDHLPTEVNPLRLSPE
jgi:hypothetical protein